MHVLMVDGTKHELDRPSVADLVAFERTYQQSASQVDERVEWLTFVFWSALRRRKQIAADVRFEDWIEQVEAIDMVEEEAAPAGDVPGEAAPDTPST